MDISSIASRKLSSIDVESGAALALPLAGLAGFTALRTRRKTT